ncbi:hypothetical protein A4G29_21180 [Mycobacterium kansasii]|nr:hypothetical protein A4G29_21180 [Mycobacterium kansasii]
MADGRGAGQRGAALVDGRYCADGNRQCVLLINAVPFMIPALEAARGTALAEAGLLSAMPSLGMVVTLIAWGYVADRIGERTVLATGSALTAG